MSDREAQLPKFAWSQVVHGCNYLGNVGLDFGPTGGRENQDCQPPAGEVLLMAQAPVGRDKDVELHLSGLQKLTIFESRPAHLIGRDHLVARQLAAQWYRCALVEEDSHEAVRIRFGSSCLGKALFGVLENGFDMLSGHPGKPSQKVVHARSAFEVLEQGLDRHTRSLEEPSTADLCRIPFNRRTLTPIEHGSRIAEPPTPV